MYKQHGRAPGPTPPHPTPPPSSPPLHRLRISNVPGHKPYKLEDGSHPHRTSLVGVHAAARTPQIVTCDRRGLMKLWDIRMFRCVHTFTVGAMEGSQMQYYPREINSFAYVDKLQQILVSDSRRVFIHEYNEGADPKVHRRAPLNNSAPLGEWGWGDPPPPPHPPWTPLTLKTWGQIVFQTCGQSKNFSGAVGAKQFRPKIVFPQKPSNAGGGGDGWDSAWRNRAPGPHAHRNTARQATDGLWTEARG